MFARGCVMGNVRESRENKRSSPLHSRPVSVATDCLLIELATRNQ